MKKNDNDLTAAFDKNGAQEIRKYLLTKGENHQYYKTYGSLKYIESSINEHYLLLSNGQNWNDPNDRAKFYCDETYYYYGKCFSFSKSESVAMWVMYANEKEETGAMVNITGSTMKKIISSSTKFDAMCGNFDKKWERIRIAEEDIYLTDVLYVGVGANEDTKCIKRSDEVCDRVDDINGFDKIITKTYAWNYENECRLVVRVKKELIDNLNNKEFLKLFYDENQIDNLKKRIILSPLNKDNSDDYTKSRLELNWDKND
ncbi:MAG: DUF2971 domain-containing protein [Erysipelotrichaceae bacterium]|nr:DUF2971 domain-containing protein [Erysipelotrichaceae bacterium]